jgi:hypothetical protein
MKILHIVLPNKQSFTHALSMIGSKSENLVRLCIYDDGHTDFHNQWHYTTHASIIGWGKVEMEVSKSPTFNIQHMGEAV